MKLVTFEVSGSERAGIWVGGSGSDAVVVDLETALRWFEREAGRPGEGASVAERYGRGVLGFVEHAAEARPAADAIVQRFAERKTPASFDGRPFSYAASAVTLRAPIPRPPSMRDGYAFRQHVETARRNRGLEMIPEFDQFPVFYFTNHQGVIGPATCAHNGSISTGSTSSWRGRSSWARAGGTSPRPRRMR